MNPEHSKIERPLDRITGETSVAIIVVDEVDKAVAESNNNSICAALYSSEEFAPHCDQFCGKAFEWATDAGKPVDYICHAGLACRAVPIKHPGKQVVAIVGRTFVKAENYRKAAERAINGDWKQFPPSEFFGNVLISGSVANIENAVSRLEQYSPEGLGLRAGSDSAAEQAAEKAAMGDSEVREPVTQPESSAGGEESAKRTAPDEQITRLVERFNREAEGVTREAAGNNRPPIEAIRSFRDEVGEWRSLFSSLNGMDYRTACSAVLDFIAARYGFRSLVWFERQGDHFDVFCSRGDLADVPIKIGMSPDDKRVEAAVNSERPVVFRERRRYADGGRVLNLFPVIVSGELRAGLGVEGRLASPDSARLITRFCRRVGPQIEILRLRNEVSERDWLAKAVRKFNESLKQIDKEDFWTHVTQISAELLQAERASLLIRKEKSQDLLAKASVGATVNLANERKIGDRVSKLVLDEGKPVVVRDIDQVAIDAAPEDWKYRTSSFISYPIIIGERRIAVLNFTDKASGESFTERDLDLLQAIAPQIAVAIDRTELKDKAGEFEQLSVTDPLTGLSNRRYIERRLEEEIERSKRHRFPMSLMMVDVDEFKSYNDSFGHPAGDVALKIVATVLNETLRSADVAARYGGEEFAILLPQTTASEAAAIAERIRTRVEHTDFPKRRVTISIGIAACSSDVNTPVDIIAAADHALYEAKNHGRNNVQIYDAFGKPFNEKIH